jgi:hypothetical protein
LKGLAGSRSHGYSSGYRHTYFGMRSLLTCDPGEAGGAEMKSRFYLGIKAHAPNQIMAVRTRLEVSQAIGRTRSLWYQHSIRCADKSAVIRQYSTGRARHKGLGDFQALSHCATRNGKLISPAHGKNGPRAGGPPAHVRGA